MWYSPFSPVVLRRGRIFLTDRVKGQKLCENMTDSKCGTQLNLGRSIKLILFTSNLHHKLNLQFEVPSLL